MKMQEQAPRSNKSKSMGSMSSLNSTVNLQHAQPLSTIKRFIINSSNIYNIIIFGISRIEIHNLGKLLGKIFFKLDIT